MKKDKENTTQRRYAKKTYLLAIYMLTNEDKKLKRYILILGCFLSLSTYAAAEESKQKFTAKIPDSTTIELVGLRYFDIRYLKKFTDRDISRWRADGSPLPDPPDKHQ